LLNSKNCSSFTTEYDDYNQKLYFDFKRTFRKLYDQNITGALTDFFEKSNDTLNFKLNTKPVEDYGNLTVVLANAKQFPVIIELTNEKVMF
jgi:hypothetical protein